MSGSDRKPKKFKGIGSFFKKISEGSSSGSHSSNLGPCENVVSQGFNSQREAYN